MTCTCAPPHFEKGSVTHDCQTYIQLYTAVCLREGKRGTCLGPPFAAVTCKVAYLAFKWGTAATAMYKYKRATFLSKGPPTAVVM